LAQFMRHRLKWVRRQLADYIRYAAAFSYPWFAIGGIDVNNVNDVISAGAERVAVVRALMKQSNPL